MCYLSTKAKKGEHISPRIHYKPRNKLNAY